MSNNKSLSKLCDIHISHCNRVSENERFSNALSLQLLSLTPPHPIQRHQASASVRSRAGEGHVWRQSGGSHSGILRNYPHSGENQGWQSHRRHSDGRVRDGTHQSVWNQSQNVRHWKLFFDACVEALGCWCRCLCPAPCLLKAHRSSAWREEPTPRWHLRSTTRWRYEFLSFQIHV